MGACNAPLQKATRVDSSLIGIACFLVFLLMAALMYTRHLSTLLALPIMAVAIAVIAQVPTKDILSEIINQGALKYGDVVTTAMFGAVLAELINQQGIAKSLVRWVAEFGGDNPFMLGILLTLVTAVLFSTLGGLGAVIMVGTIVLPVMLSLGISAVTAAGLLLFGISFGGMFNLTNWQLYINTLGLTRQDMMAFLLPFSAVVALGIMTFLFVQLGARHVKSAIATVFVLLLGYGVLYYQMSSFKEKEALTATPESILVATVLLGLLIVYALYRHLKRVSTLPSLALITPLIPLLLVLVCHWEFIPAFVAGITYGVLICWQHSSVNILTKSIIEGISQVVPAIVLIIGLGMLVKSVMHPNVSQAMAPLLQMSVPSHALAYVIGFTVFAPLCLYRGPLNMWGMGAGLLSLISKVNILSSKAILGMVWSVGQIQGICDPANTQNLWVANYLAIDTQTILKNTLPYAWTLAFLGLCLAVGFGYVSF